MFSVSYFLAAKTSLQINCTQQPVYKHMKLLGLDWRQQTWGPAAHFNPLCPQLTHRAICWTLSFHRPVRRLSLGVIPVQSLDPTDSLPRHAWIATLVACGAGGTDASLGLIGLSTFIYFIFSSSLCYPRSKSGIMYQELRHFLKKV